MHVRTCWCTPPQTCLKHLSNGSLVTHQIWTQSAQPFARSGKRMCTVRTCRCTPPQTCGKHLSNGSLVTHQIWTLSGQPLWSYRGRGCLRHPLPGTCHVPWQAPVDIGTGQIRNLLNGDIEKRRPLVNRSTLSRVYKLLKSVMGSGRVGSGRVGSGWAAHTEISPLNHRRTRSALRAPLVIRGNEWCHIVSTGTGPDNVLWAPCLARQSSKMTHPNGHIIMYRYVPIAW